MNVNECELSDIGSVERDSLLQEGTQSTGELIHFLKVSVFLLSLSHRKPRTIKLLLQRTPSCNGLRLYQQG